MMFSMVLRVPLIFVIDELFKGSFWLTEFGILAFSFLINIILWCLIFCLWICLFVLPSKYLCQIYYHVFSVCIVLLFYQSNKWTLNIKHFVYAINCKVVIQCSFFLVFLFLHKVITKNPVDKVLYFSFLIPTLCATIPVTQGFLNIVVILAALTQLFIILKTIWLNKCKLTNIIYDGFNHLLDTIKNHGIHYMFMIELNRLQLANVIRTFWTIRVLVQCIYVLNMLELKNEAVFGAVKYLMIEGCNTFTALLGMTSIVSLLFLKADKFFQWALLAKNVDDRIIGITSAFAFYVLALQTGLTNLEPEKRFSQLNQNFCKMTNILLNHVHYVVHESLVSLGNSLNPSLNSHFKVLLFCVWLIVFPTFMLKYVWSNYFISTWLLSVTLWNVEIIVRVLVSLTLYVMYFYDAHCSTFWEKLHDYKYYIEEFECLVILCSSIFHVLIGLHKTVFVSIEFIHILLLCLHFYSNVWCTGREFWKKLIVRRTVMKKIEFLLEATSGQLLIHNDICPICYNHMSTAKITHCHHYFHEVCLRIWMYEENQCPVCNTKIENLQKTVKQNN